MSSLDVSLVRVVAIWLYASTTITVYMNKIDCTSSLPTTLTPPPPPSVPPQIPNIRSCEIWINVLIYLYIHFVYFLSINCIKRENKTRQRLNLQADKRSQIRNNLQKKTTPRSNKKTKLIIDDIHSTFFNAYSHKLGEKKQTSNTHTRSTKKITKTQQKL